MPIAASTRPTSNVVRLTPVPCGTAAVHARQAGEAGAIRLFHRDQQIFADGDVADIFYEVIAGAVRTCKLLPDGRRQINAFHMRGSIFGIEAGAEHRFFAEAVGNVTLRAYRRRSLEQLAASDPTLACRLIEAVASALQRAHDHMLLLGRKQAREKIASFLLDLRERTATPEGIEIPMSRTDIADHLGLTIETISRTLLQLKRGGVIALVSIRLFRICDLAALRRIGEGKAGGPDKPAGAPSALPNPLRPPRPRTLVAAEQKARGSPWTWMGPGTS